MATHLSKAFKQNEKRSLQINKSKQIKLFETIREQRMSSIPAFPNQKGKNKQISRDIGVSSNLHQKQVRININNTYRKHLSTIQQHHNKIMHLIDTHQRRHMKSQEKSSIEIIKQEKKSARKATISLKQQKALANKKHDMLAKSKKVQQSLIRWREIVNKNRTIEKQKKVFSARALQQLQQKINATASRKTKKLKQITSQMKQMTRKVDSKQSSRKKTQNLSDSRVSRNSIKAYANAFNNRTIHNPEQQLVRSSSLKKQPNLQSQHIRYQSNIIGRHSIAHQKTQRSSFISKQKNISRAPSSNRVSTERIAKKRQQLEQAELQKILYQKQDKTQRIKQARQIKRYLNQQKQNRAKQNLQRMSELTLNHRDENKKKSQVRKQQLNSKFKQNRGRMREVSLPAIHKSKMLEQQFYELIRNQQEDISLANTFNYEKMISQKLKNMSLIMEKYVPK